MKTNKWLLLVVQTALLLALTLIFQIYVRSMLPAGIINTLVVGSLVNLCLFAAAGTVGWRGSLAIAILSPVVAAFMGHLPTPLLIPFVAVGNAVLCVLFELVIRKHESAVATWSAVAIAAVAKTVTLYLLVVLVFNNLLAAGTGLPTKLIAALAINFSWPQLVTAVIGGAIAVPVIKAVRNAVGKLGREGAKV